MGVQDEVWKANLCHGIIPAGGALVVKSRDGNISCKERSKLGHDLGYYQQLNALSWKMRRTYWDSLSTRSRTDDVDWNNVFDGGKLANGSKQGVCRGYISPEYYAWDQKLYKKATKQKLQPKNFKSLLLGRLENDTCIGELHGMEVKMSNFEYLTKQTSSRVRWVKSDGGRAGKHEAMYAGVDWNTHLLAICRAPYKGAVHAGKQYGNTCRIGVDDKGIGIKAPFEVLVLR